MAHHARLARLQRHLGPPDGSNGSSSASAGRAKLTSRRPLATHPHQEAAAAPGSLSPSGATSSTAAAFMKQLVDSGKMAGGAIGVAVHGKLVLSAGFGTYLPVQDTVDGVAARDGSDATPRQVQADTVFLVASLTKVATATAVMMLIEGGQLEGLDQLLCSVLPDCRGPMRSITIRHLLTHTSGLPDEFPDNTALRRAGAPLSDFAARILAVAPQHQLLYPPGTDIAYQSTGVCLLGAVVEAASGVPLTQFLREKVFEPLGMTDTTLGERDARQQGAYGARREAATVLAEQTDFMALNGVVAGAESDDSNWNWNSDFWRGLGAPWGGLLTSVSDMNRFCQLFVNGGVDSLSGIRLLSAATVGLMTTPQTHVGQWTAGAPPPPALPGLTPEGREATRGTLPSEDAAGDLWPDAWGLGWRMNQAQKQFGTENPERLFGHHGATGAMMWCDAESGVSCAILTSQPSLCYSAEFNEISDLVLRDFS